MRGKKKIGLVLGGGGARGLAHIGVIKVLESEGLTPDIIIGTSVGAIVGGALACGMNSKEIEKRLHEFLESDLYQSSQLKTMGDAGHVKEQRLSKRIQSYFQTRIRLAQAIFRPGILDICEIEQFINFFIPDIDIEETRIPFRAVATDLVKGECAVLRKGSLRKSILASSAVPGALEPVELNGRTLSDGGIICEVPVALAVEEGSNFVIAVSVDKDISSVPELQAAVDIYVRAGEIQGFYLKEHDLKRADIVIRPFLGDTHWMDFSEPERLIYLGEAAAKDNAEPLKKLAKEASRKGLLGGIKKLIGGLNE